MRMSEPWYAPNGRHMTTRALLMSLASLGVWVSAQATGLDAKQWWVAMNDALVHQSYQVEVVHQSAARVERVKVWHRNKDGRVEEHLINMGAHGREIIRVGSDVKVIFPTQHVVLVQENATLPLYQGVPVINASVEKHYQVALLPDTPQVMGHPCVVLSIRPKDDYRYGYRLTIDSQSQLPLKNELVDLQGNTLEQWLFTDIQRNPEMLEQGLRPLQDVSSFKERVASGDASPDNLSLPANEGLAHLPPGFELQQLNRLQNHVLRLLLSDGLANVSVFLESAAAGPWLKRHSEGRVGASLVISEQWDDHKLTLVGEVPRATMEAVAISVRENENLWKQVSGQSE